MNPGKMNERITFYGIESKKDDYGDKIETKVDKYACWASVRTQYLKEVQATIGTVLENTITFFIRYKKQEIDTAWKVEWRGQPYEIIQVNPDHVKKDITAVIVKKVS
ncbi:putative phage head-tail adaptor [Fictibacillus macauensis ZFHKF-1]|uniref:Putative phage head-tail adaptor n=1 Tax=Fictibacillus macauensis ZFHKF-1 TaxID=1196324 RepID=I8J2E3_9BACL|nr:phage head closure protein [Fictibacillus macauensis]EIT85911.1 putative phage head-tail adaptor [Fictibacillus macauensis ZFHKF-1]